MHIRSFIYPVLFIMVSLLPACGGGGGGGGGGGDGDGGQNSVSSSSIAQLKQQTLGFFSPDLKMTVGASIGNSASGQGSGLITYSSSNTSVATVESNGIVTAKAVGTAIITATIAADSIYDKASATYSVSVKSLENQTLVFDQPGPLTLTAGNTLVNIAKGPGTGLLAYRSDNTDVATVNSEGHVTATKAGTAVITATKESDDKYYGTQNSYVINVLENTSLGFNAWIGTKDSEIKLPASVNLFSLYAGTSPDCDIANYTKCTNELFNVSITTAITSNSTTLSAPGYYVLKDSNKLTEFFISTKNLPPRYAPQIVSFKNQLFLFAGHDGNYNRFNDVWTSIDGRTWRLRTTNSAFATLNNHKIVVFNNKLWAVGGLWSNRSDIWSSTDGVNWIQEVANAPFSARYYQQVVNFKNQLWLVGGYDGTEFKNDVWTSSDGINWTQATSAASFVADRRTISGNGTGSYITSEKLLAFNDKLWLFRPLMNSNTPGELWSSTDGVTWEKISTSSSALNRWEQQIVAFKGRMYVISGKKNGTTIQSSADGISWSDEPGNYVDDQQNHRVIEHNNQLISIGGSIHDDIASNVHVSTNAIKWKSLTPYGDFPAQSKRQATSFNNKLWVLGGEGRNDIWASEDGITWNEQLTDTQFPTRNTPSSLISFKNKLWLIGGENYAGSENEIWSSTNGINWIKEVANADFPRRGLQHLTVHNNQLWIYGGYGGTGILNDIWTSNDGVTWQKKTDNASLPSRAGASFISYNDQLWIIGGAYQGKAYNDIWSSADGVNWTQETSAAAFSPRQAHAVTVFNGQLLLIGGQANGNYLDDAWISTNGISWTKQQGATSFSARSFQNLVIHNGKIFMIGGEHIPAGSTWSQATNDVWSSSDAINWRLGFQGQIMPLQ